MNTEKIKDFMKNNQIGTVLIISLLLFVITIIINPLSFNKKAFASILALTAMLALASAGQTLVIISDGIDMSIGAIMSMTAVLTVTIMQKTDSVPLFIEALIVSIIVGGVIGYCNGVGAIIAGLPPLVVTLYISNIVTRLQYVITGGSLQYTSVSNQLKQIITYRIYNVFPIVVFFGIFIFVLMYFLLNRTRFGQQLYLTGNNNRAAQLTGVNTKKVKILNYTMAGVLSGFAGVIGAANSGYIQSGTFNAMTMESIVAVVLGGTLLTGGKGKYLGTVAGALLLIVLSNSLAVLQVSESIKNIIMGVMLIVLLSVYNREKSIVQ